MPALQPRGTQTPRWSMGNRCIDSWTLWSAGHNCLKSNILELSYKIPNNSCQHETGKIKPHNWIQSLNESVNKKKKKNLTSLLFCAHTHFYEHRNLSFFSHKLLARGKIPELHVGAGWVNNIITQLYCSKYDVFNAPTPQFGNLAF